MANWLHEQSHDVFSVYDEARGMDDAGVLEKAHAENRILITNDKDFGEMVYRDRMLHRGVILLRLDDQRAASKIASLRALLDVYADRLADEFVVVSETAVRFARIR